MILNRLSIGYALAALTLIQVSPVLAGMPQSFDGRIKITLNSDQKSFLVAETVLLEAKVSNLLDSALTVPDPSQMQALKVLLIDESGNWVHSRISIFRLGYDSLVLNGGETYDEAITLMSYANDSGGRILTPGSYRISVKLADVESNIVPIQIVDPPPAEMDLRKRLMKFRWSLDESDDMLVKQMREALLANPHSAYVKDIYYQLWAIYASKNDFADLEESALEFLTRDPESIACGTALHYYQQGIEGMMGLHEKARTPRQQSAIRADLISLKQRLTNTRTARYIDQLLRERERQ